MAERAEKEKTSGKKPRGKVPQAPDPTARAEDQVNLTDEESRIMKCHGGAFEQCFNAQAAVDTQSYLIVAAHVTQASNDKQQVEPMLKQLKALPEQMGKVAQALMDTGYYSERNIELCEKNQIEPYIAVGRDAHHPDAMSRFSEPAPLPEGATRVEKMGHTLKTRAGRAVYAVRKSTVEPVFGVIKSVMGFRQFSVRGLEKTNGEWSLVCLAWNLKRMAKLHSSCVKSG